MRILYIKRMIKNQLLVLTNKQTIMKQIIGLKGSAQKGKTETLNLLIDLLEVATTGCSMPAPQPVGNNRKRTFIYNGNKVSICTAGDNLSELLANRVYFETEKCDIAISAARTSGATHDVLNDLAKKNNIKVSWIKKIYDLPSKDKVNAQQAIDIFNML